MLGHEHSRAAAGRSLAAPDQRQRLDGRRGRRASACPSRSSGRAGCAGWCRCRRRPARACLELDGCTRGERRALARSGAASAWIVKRKRRCPRRPRRRSRLRCEPPIASASRRLIARPEPGAAVRRVCDASTWLNDWNRPPMRSARDADARVAHVDGDLPAPSAAGRPASRRWPCIVSTTSPRSVNLTAFESRLSTIWRSRAGVAARSRPGTSGVDDVGQLEALPGGAWRRAGRAPPRRTRERRTGCDSSSSARPRSSRSRGCR